MANLDLFYSVITLFIWILLADFLTGVVHFWMDVYGKEDMPFVGKMVIEINVLHHSDPRHMIKQNYWFLTRASWLLAVIIYVISWVFMGAHSWKLAIFLVYAAQANLFHKWAHQHSWERSRFATVLQKLYIIQSPHHHHLHHNEDAEGFYDRQYCILTNFLNPILDKIWFWEFVVWFFGKLGIQTRDDCRLRNVTKRLG